MEKTKQARPAERAGGGEASGWHPQPREADMKGCAHRAAARRRRVFVEGGVQGTRRLRDGVQRTGDSGAPGGSGPAADAPPAAGTPLIWKIRRCKDHRPEESGASVLMKAEVCTVAF